MVGMAIYSFLVVFFYTFLGLFLGNRIAEITITTLFSFVVMYRIRLSIRFLPNQIVTFSLRMTLLISFSGTFCNVSICKVHRH